MKVIDINGYELEIPDLDRAIEMAEFFKDCHHDPPLPIDKERQEYWSDLYEKLCKIKAAQPKKNNNCRR